MRRQHLWLAVLAAALGSCAGGDDLSLAGGDDDLDEILHRRLAITVTPGPTGFEGAIGVGFQCTVDDCTVDGLSAAALHGCERDLAMAGLNRPVGACADWAIESEAEICAATTMLRIVEDPRGAEVFLSDGFGNSEGVARFTPQDAESNYDIARVAMSHALRGAAIAEEAMASSTCTLALLRTPAGAGGLAGLTLLDRFSQFQSEGIDLAMRARDDFALAAAAVSDSLYSESTDTRAASDAIASIFVSRTAAAHVLAGGELGLPALRTSDRGFFSHNRLSAEAQAALELIRAAAIDPLLVLSDTMDVDALMYDAGDPESTVALRLALMQGNAPLAASTSAAAAYEILGVSRQGFLEARQHLGEELRAFDRSRDVLLPAERLAAGDSTDDHGIDLYAATRVPPRHLLPAYWAAILRHDSSPTPLITGYSTWTSPPAWQIVPTSAGAVAPGFTYGDESMATFPITVIGARSLASIYPEIYARSAEVTARLETLAAGCSGDPVCLGELARAERTIAGTYAALSGAPEGIGTMAALTWRYDSAEYLGDARACWYSVDPTEHDVRIEVRGPIRAYSTDKFRVVSGHDGLNCAVRGEIEGVPCDETALDALTPTQNWSVDGDSYVARVSDVQAQSGSLPRPRAGVVPLFVVSRRTGPSPTIAPGGWDPVVGFVLPEPAAYKEGYRYCQSAAITPELDRAVSRLVEPATRAPFQSAESCAGISVDQLIPLENELTDDGNGIESSWRHYLQLARAASDEADALGDQLVRTGLELDLRGEQAADDLNRLCGVSVNVSSVSEALAMMPPVDGGSPPCDVPYVERDGTCILDPVLFAAQQAVRDDESGRLASCLGADTVEFATMGDTRLCIWDAAPGVPGGICEGAHPDTMPCPTVLASGATSCTGPLPMGMTWIPVDDTVGLFARPVDPPPQPPNPSDLPCAQLARAREGVATLDDVARIWTSQLMRYESFQQLAQALSWEANVGDYSVVRYGGAGVFRTGSPSAPMLTSSSQWPMGNFVPQGTVCPDPTYFDAMTGEYTNAADTVGLASYHGSLFCLGGLHDASREQRARMNNVLARAVLAARVLTGNSVSPMILPFYQRASLNQMLVFDSRDTVVDGTTSTLCADSAQVRLDLDDDDPAPWGDPYNVDLADLGERACIVGPGEACGGGVEWTHCVYDGTGCTEYDARCGGPDPDHGTARLVLGSAGDAFTPATAVNRALEIWPMLAERTRWMHELTSAEADEVLLGPSSDLRRRLTTYWDGDCYQGHFPSCYERANGIYGTAGNDAAFDHLTVNDWLNGVELACVGARQSEPSILVSACGDRPEAASLADAYRVASFLECQANEISQYGSETIVENLPARVVRALVAQSTGQLGTGAGEFDRQVSDVRAAIIDIANARIGMAEDTRRIAGRVRSLRARIATHERSRTIEDLLTASAVLDRATTCAAETAKATGIESATGGSLAAAASVCTNSAVQTFIALQVNRLRGADIDDAIIQEYVAFNDEMADFGQAMSERNLAVRAAFERLDGAVASIRSTQTQARRALARVLHLEDDGTGAHFDATASYRSIYNTTLVRYRRAHDRARRAAYIARRAIEQRLGMSLLDIEDDVFSGEAPREWVDRLCRMPAIDYDRIRAGSMASPDAGPTATSDVLPPDDYSGAYVGDYVDQLEGLLESYNFVYPFREGTDTAVISLRDDVLQTRAPCATDSLNLLYGGGNLRQRQSVSQAGWTLTGCGAPSAGPCLQVDALDELPGLMETEYEGPVPESGFDLGWPRPFRVTFGVGGSTTSTRLEQHVVLGPGRHRVSWYARAGTLSTPSASLVDVQTVGGATLITDSGYTPLVEHGWSRVWAFVTVPSEQEAVIVVHDASASLLSGFVDVTGIMLEDVSDTVRGSLTAMEGEMTRGQASSAPPWLDAGSSVRRLCSDDTGLYFRGESWRTGCVRVCPDGYDGSCSADAASQRCYRETTLSIAADTLQRLLVGRSVGFAGGNYNYRVDSVAVNLVGTALRDCTGMGAGCYSSGNFSYSMLHAGPYLLRNARGAWFESLLFPGRIESARALAAERYLTNPISSADTTLIQPYNRVELGGRPLAGTLILRVWDEPGFRFDRLEDVQIVLTYRYWQHQR